MPMIKIEYDDNKLGDDEVKKLSGATQKIVSDVTEIKDVFVYANSARVKVQIAPVEIFVEMSDHKIADLEDLTNKIKSRLKDWKSDSGFKVPINLTVIPMHWQVEVGI